MTYYRHFRSRSACADLDGVQTCSRGSQDRHIPSGAGHEPGGGQTFARLDGDAAAARPGARRPGRPLSPGAAAAPLPLLQALHHHPVDLRGERQHAVNISQHKTAPTTCTNCPKKAQAGLPTRRRVCRDETPARKKDW